MLTELKKIKSGKKEIRDFARVVGSVLLVLGLFLCWRHRPSGPWLIVIAAVLLILGHTVPTVLRPLQKAWMALAVIMGWFMSRIILSVLFYAVLCPITIFARLTGKKFLDLGFRNPNSGSYWIKRSEPKTKQDYERQY